MMDMADKFWDMGNYITGFAVAQVLATTYALGKREMKGLHDSLGHWLAFCTTLVLTVFYMIAIVFCGNKGRELSTDHSPIWTEITYARIITVCLFTLILLGTLYGHRHDQKEEELRRSLTQGGTISG